jgi:hypothetical protein
VTGAGSAGGEPHRRGELQTAIERQLQVARVVQLSGAEISRRRSLQRESPDSVREKVTPSAMISTRWSLDLNSVLARFAAQAVNASVMQESTPKTDAAVGCTRPVESRRDVSRVVRIRRH